MASNDEIETFDELVTRMAAEAERIEARRREADDSLALAIELELKRRALEIQASINALSEEVQNSMYKARHFNEGRPK